MRAKPVEFSADHITINRESGALIATGNVLFSQAPNMSLKAARVEYNRESGQAIAIGNGRFHRPCRQHPFRRTF